MVGYDTPEQVMEAVHYETATMEEKDYATVLAGAPRHAYMGQCTLTQFASRSFLRKG